MNMFLNIEQYTLEILRKYFGGHKWQTYRLAKKLFCNFLATKKTKFLIPDYQRPYAWSENECQTLWDDLFSFSFPENNYNKFDNNNEYYLGSIVTFKNNKGEMEVIDGQQRLTTLLLLLRAFYEKYKDRNDDKAKQNKDEIEKCIWEKDAFKDEMDILKIESEVATDDDKEIFLKILQDGEAPTDNKSNYAENYRFFKKKID